MSALLHQRASEVFSRVRRLPPDQRDELLAEVCGGDDSLLHEVRSLLEFHDAAPDDALADAGPFAFAASTERSPLPRAFGRYNVLRLLGAGGMGEVYLAEQQDPRRQVAVKALRSGLSSDRLLARFRMERQALAVLNHPGIARIHDGGRSDAGQPFVVMEYVPGVSITEYCRAENLTIEARIELFIEVCDAVHSAHQKGIVHRDLKPSNILVSTQDGKPVCKVIDFGIAKALGEQEDMPPGVTLAGQIIGTPAYMSPEQFETPLAVDTRSDVYSLGVLLYEILTGELPFGAPGAGGADVLELLRMARGSTPVKPSTRVGTPGAGTTAPTDRRRLARRLRHDLDWIVLRCLEKDPSHRYASAAELGADLARHLRHEPVTVGPPTISYQLRKLVRRHPIPAASLLIAASLIMVASATTWVLYRRAVAAEVEATRGLHRSERAFGFLQQTYDTLGRDYARDPMVTIRDTLRLARLRVDEEFKDEPAIRAEVRTMLAQAFEDQGMFRSAEEQLSLALADLEPLGQAPEALRVQVVTRVALARLLADQGRAAEGSREAARAVAGLAGIGSVAPELEAEARLIEAYCLVGTQPAEAEARFRVLVEGDAPTRDGAVRQARACSFLADLVGRDESRRAEAIELWERSCAIGRDRMDPMDPRRFELILRHAKALERWSMYEPAARMLQEACAQIDARQAKSWHPSYRSIAFLHERVLLTCGRVEEAKQRALARADGKAVPAYQDLAMTAMMELKDPDLAGTLATAAFEEHRKQFPRATMPPPITAAAMAWSLVRQGKCEEAREIIRRLDVMTQGEGSEPGGFRRGFLPIMIEFAEACDRPEMATRWRAELESLDARRLSE